MYPSKINKNPDITYIPQMDKKGWELNEAGKSKKEEREEDPKRIG